MDKRVILDLDACIECKSCSAVCFYGHGAVLAQEFAGMAQATLPAICRHCDAAACVEACPTSALQKTDGRIVRSSMLCVGCKSCVFACPFGVIEPQLTRHHINKCDGCEDRVAEGKEPRCVVACPAGARKYAEPEEVYKEGLLLLSGRTAGEHPIKRR